MKFFFPLNIYQIAFPAITFVGDYFVNSTEYKHISDLEHVTFLSIFGAKIKHAPLWEYFNNDTDKIRGALVKSGVCFNSYGFTIIQAYETTRYIVTQFKKDSPRKWFINQFSSWNQKTKPKFSEMLTRRGMGFTFNALEASELLNLNQ